MEFERSTASKTVITITMIVVRKSWREAKHGAHTHT